VDCLQLARHFSSANLGCGVRVLEILVPWCGLLVVSYDWLEGRGGELPF
jgi:hypothetical protein